MNERYRTDEVEVLLLPILRQKLKELNPGVITDDARAEAIVTRLNVTSSGRRRFIVSMQAHPDAAQRRRFHLRDGIAHGVAGGERWKDETPQQDDAEAEQPAQIAPEAPNMGSVNLREAAERLLAAWEETPPQNANEDPVARAMAMLRSALTRRGTRATGAPRKPREGTKQEVVLAMLRRPEGATVAQIAEATGWAQHTVRGFFAGLKKRQGITVEIAERIRQVGPNKQGAKGSYTVYRVAE